MEKNRKLLLLTSVMITLFMCGAVPSIASQSPFGGALFAAADNVGTELLLNLTLDNQHYNQGKTIQIWGTVRDSENTPLENGTATIQLSCGGWKQQCTAPITNGVFNYNYVISYGNPNGNWVVTVTVEDNLGNSGTASENATVAVPAHIYYTVQFSTPVANLSYMRGENVSVSVNVSEGAVAVENAEVSFNSPSGEKIALNRTAPGTYSARYVIGWDDSLENWCISAEAKKTVENVLKAGGSWIPVQVRPAPLDITLISPTQRMFKSGESIELKVRISYPSGEPLENLPVSIATPRGENLGLAYEGNGIYAATYSFGSEDVGSWRLELAVADSSGNSNSVVIIIDVVQPGVVETILSRYWWAFLSAVVVVAVASVHVVKRRRFLSRLRRIKIEMAELDKLEKEAVTRYFKEGSLSRSTFDRLTRKFERRRAELTTEEGILSAKVKEKAKKKKK